MKALLKPIAKAVVASLGSALSFLGGAMSDGTLATQDVVSAIGAGLVIGFAAWRVSDGAIR